MQRNENDSSKSSSSVFLTIGLLLALHCTCLSTLLHAAQDALQTIWQTGVRGGINKLAKLRRHASQVHVWSGVEWCGVEWSGVELCGVVWSFFSLFTFHLSPFTVRCSLFTFHFSLRATRDWKSESVTDLQTDGHG